MRKGQLYNWGATSAFIARARSALQNAISSSNEPDTKKVAISILEWGLNPSGVTANINQLSKIATTRRLFWYQYLSNVGAAISLATLDTVNITAHLIPYASSGTSKLHSLASTDGLVIFDSRVAAMLGECINEFLRRRRAIFIPNPLKIYVELNHSGSHQRRPKPLRSGSNHSAFVRDHRWIECQVRVSWLFEEALKQNMRVFPGLPLPERMHRLEAAAFMMGAYLEPGPFNGRSFTFAKV